MNQQSSAILSPRTETGFVAKFTNFVLFQSVWLITVLGAARGLTWPGLTAIGLFVLIHGLIMRAPKNDYTLLAILIFIGFVCDTALVRSGLLHVTTEFPLHGFAPLWMLVLWANLALSVNHCLGWLHNRYWLASSFGAVGGPAAYIGGSALGAGEFNADFAFVVLSIAILWIIITPALFWMAARIETGFPSAQ